jgi:hypothetical protein
MTGKPTAYTIRRKDDGAVQITIGNFWDRKPIADAILDMQMYPGARRDTLIAARATGQYADRVSTFRGILTIEWYPYRSPGEPSYCDCHVSLGHEGHSLRAAPKAGAIVAKIAARAEKAAERRAKRGLPLSIAVLGPESVAAALMEMGLTEIAHFEHAGDWIASEWLTLREHTDPSTLVRAARPAADAAE